MSKDDSIIYKRGTFEKNGKLCGHNSDSSLRRIFPVTERPLLQLVDVGGVIFLRVRQATKQGYIDCSCPGVVDLSYPSSTMRRGRVICDGKIASTLTSSFIGMYVFVEI